MPGMKGTMDEFKAGSLHSGSKKGPVVKNRKQAIAIGLSQQRKAGGGGFPPLKRKKMPDLASAAIEKVPDKSGRY